MQPQSITLRSFKCFSGETTFTFPQQAGLYLVQGQNMIQPQLEGNGCGKSTLFGDALTWCLFGKTPRLLKAGDVINWEAGSTASVQFNFQLGGVEYAILRTQTPNSLCLDIDGVRQTATQDQIESLLGLDFDGFIASIVFAQFNSMFFDLTASEKSVLLSKVLDLDLWDTVTDATKRSATQLESTLNDVLRRISHVEGQIDSLLGQDFSEKVASWEEQHEKECQELQKELKKPQLEMEKITYIGNSLERELEEVSEQFNEVELLCDETMLERKKLEKHVQKHNENIKVIHSHIHLVEKELEKFKTVKNECPFCLQKVTKAHLMQEQGRCKEKLDVFHEERRYEEQLIGEWQQKIEKIEEDLSEINEVRRELLEDRRKLDGEKSNLKSQYVKWKTTEQALQKQLEKLSQQVNPYAQEVQKQQKKLEELKNVWEKDSNESKVLEKELHGTQFWVKAFREVRLSLISEVLTQLELEVNNKLFQLGLQDWKVLFAVEGLTKAGKVKKGFTVTISTPYNLEPVNWNAWSGGESQRLRLAGALGMADLITARCPYMPAFEVFDEPSSYLSEAGISSLLEILSDRARTTGKQIYLIDHRRLDASKFDGLVSIVKSTDGVEINTTFA